MIHRLGSRQCAQKVFPSIPRFPPSTLDASKASWVPEEAWDDRQKRAFIAFRQQTRGLSLANPVSFVDARRKAPPMVLMRYVLTGASETASERLLLAAAEIEGDVRAFRSVRIALSGCKSPGGWCDEKTSLAMLISATCLRAEADILTLNPLTSDCAAQLMQLSLGQTRQVRSPFNEFRMSLEMLRAQRHQQAMREGTATTESKPASLLVESTLVDIVPSHWWQTNLGAESRRSLSYLEKRISRLKRSEQPHQKRPSRPPSALVRLSKLFLGRS